MNRSAILKGLSVFTALFLLSIVFQSCKSKKEEQSEPPALKVIEITGTNVPVYLQLVGQATGIPTVEIRARVAGYLKNWTFTEGSMVKKGQVLFQIEPDEYINAVDNAKADLESRKASWEKAKLDVARLKPLLATNAISQNDYDKAVTTEQQDRAGVASAEAELANAKLNLSYTSMTSPIDGMIGSCSINPGNLVGRGESTLLTTVSAVDPIYVNFQINENDYLKIMRAVLEMKSDIKSAEGVFKVLVTLSDNLPYKYPGKIDFVDRQVNPQTGTIAARAVLPNPEGLIKPGNFANVNLILKEETKGIVIPQSTLTEIQGRYFVFLVNKDNKVTRVPVQVGRSMGQKIMILKGLKEGDRILTEGFQKMKEDMIIKPVVIKDTTKFSALPQF